MEDYSGYIPKGALKLPEPPPNHHWDIQNVINSTETTTTYVIEVRLLTSTNVTALTVVEEWETKKETFSDFAISTAGLALIALDAYYSFMSINWERDNPMLNKTNDNQHSRVVTQWSSKGINE